MRCDLLWHDSWCIVEMFQELALAAFVGRGSRCLLWPPLDVDARGFLPRSGWARPDKDKR